MFTISLWNGGVLSIHSVDAKGWPMAIEKVEHFMDSSLWEGDIDRIELEEDGVLVRRWIRSGDGEWSLA